MSFDGPKQSRGEIRTSYGEVEGSLGPGERMLVMHGTDLLSYQDFFSVSYQNVKLRPWLEEETIPHFLYKQEQNMMLYLGAH